MTTIEPLVYILIGIAVGTLIGFVSGAAWIYTKYLRVAYEQLQSVNQKLKSITERWEKSKS